MNRLKEHIKAYLHTINLKYGYTDYFSIPFAYNQPMPASAASIMKKCCNILDSISQRYYLATGTALGIYRSGALIKHDSDIDIDLVGKVNFEELNSAFQANGMKLGRKVTYKNNISQLVYYSEDKVVFDMCIWSIRGEYVFNNVPELLCRVRRHPLKYYKSPSAIICNDKKYLIPAPADEWLALQYGRDWKTPKIYKRHWSKECHDIYWEFDLICMLLELSKMIRNRIGLLYKRSRHA
jgi:hypothetical protein